MLYQDSDLERSLKPEGVLSFVRSEFVNFDSIVAIDDGIYNAFGDFAIYLRNEIVEKSLSGKELQKAFKVMNTMGASKELEVQNLLVVGILEILSDEDRVVAIVRGGLVGNAADLFQKVLIGWNNG